MYYGSDTQGCVSQIPTHSQLGEVAGGQTAESKKFVHVCYLCFGHLCHLYLNDNLPKQSMLKVTVLNFQIQCFVCLIACNFSILYILLSNRVI